MTARTLRFALLADGSSDRALVPVIRWVLSEANPRAQIAQPGFRCRAPSNDMTVEMRATVDTFQPHILFVHRDAEGQGLEVRRREIPELDGMLVRVVPVRMTEAWLLFDEAAIRVAAGNPHGKEPLGLPPLRQTEELADPKAKLREALVAAAEVSGRRRKQLLRDVPALVHRVSELIDSYAPLRVLPAFTVFEVDCRRALERWRL